jgi:hypothetical protein
METVTSSLNNSQNFPLFNSLDENENYEKQLFEQYRLYVELADRTSQRRANANSFFITSNAALLTVASWFKDDFGNYMYLVSFIGIILSLYWYLCIRSYSQLNSGKFKVIHQIENRLPMNLFSYEWDLLGRGRAKKIYWPFSHIERKIPFLFIVLYISLSLFILFKL